MRFSAIIALSSITILTEISLVRGDWYTSLSSVEAYFAAFIGTLNDLYDSKESTNSPYNNYCDYIRSETEKINKNKNRTPEEDDKLEQEIAESTEAAAAQSIETCVNEIEEYKKGLENHNVDELKKNLRAAILLICKNINDDDFIQNYHKHSNIMLLEKLQDIFTGVADGDNDTFATECS